jgi:hypothetical protein
VTAQETRAEVIARRQAEKAQALEPYEPSRVEESVVRFKNGYLAGPAAFWGAAAQRPAPASGSTTATTRSGI